MMLPEAIPETRQSRSGAATFWSRPTVLAAGSALVLWLAFPPADRGYLGWVALAPLFSLVRREARPLKLYLATWFGGLVFGGLSMSWVAQTDFIGWMLMALFMSLWWPLFLLPARLGVKRLGLPLIVVAPVVWVGMEYARSLLLSGFPWYYLAHTQYASLFVIQVCDLFGAWGLSFLIAMGNVLILDLLTLPLFQRTESGSRWAATQRRKIAIVAGLVVATLVYGVVRIATSHLRPGPRLALLQTDFPQALKNKVELPEVMAKLDHLVADAAASNPRPDLIVWPETSYPVGFVQIEPGLSESDFATLARKDDPGLRTAYWRDRRQRGAAELHGLTDEIGIPMVVGAITYDFRTRGFFRFNTAALFLPGKIEVATYHKQALVVAGEYMPFLETMPWLLNLTPYTDGYVPSLSPGTGPKLLESGGVRFAPIICFEDTIPTLARRAVLGTGSSSRADVLLNLTNDGWFRGSPEQQAHLAISVFRAVECRRPLVRAVNTGISAVIDGNGRIVASLPQATEGVLSAEVPLDGRASVYLIVGDVLAIVCLTATVAIGLIAAFWFRQTPSLAQGSSVG